MSRFASSWASSPANGSCTVTVDVTAAEAGELCNKIDEGALETNHGNNTDKAKATLIVVEPAY